MSQSLARLRVAGLGIEVRTRGGIPLVAGPEHAPFLEPQAPPGLAIEFGDGEAQGWFERGAPIFNAHDVVRVFADPLEPGGQVVDVACGRRMRCEARLSPDRSQAWVRIAPWLPERTLLTLPRAYETACVTWFARVDALVVHALGLALEGVGGVLLPASTGSGKSTLGALHAASEVLSDERVALRLEGQAPTIHGTPLRATGRRVQSLGVPLRALVFLGPHGSKGFSLRPLRRAEAFRRLAFHGLPPFWDRQGLAQTLDVARAAALAVPAFEACFEPGASTPALLKEALCQAL